MDTALDGNAERILVLAPTGRDAPLACEVLEQAGLHASPCRTMEELCAKLNDGAAAVFLAEEALDPDSTTRLVAALQAQPSWSDLPLIVATQGNGPAHLRDLRRLEPVCNVTFLERPVRVMTLVSTIRMSLRARRR
jgi:hypothetical protein